MDDEANLVAPDQAPAEKMLTQSQVNAIVGREKAAAAERARREFEAQQSQAPQNMGGMKQESNAEVEERIFNRLLQKAKEFDEQQQAEERKANMEQVASNFYSQLANGKQNYADFDEVMNDFDPTAFPQLSFLAANTGMAADIMYELANDSNKLMKLSYLAERSPKQAQKEIDKLANSIKTNKQAIAENVTPNPPLSRQKSSSSVGADTGKLTVRDYRNMPWLKV